MNRALTDQEQQRLLRAAKSSNDPLAQRDYWWMRALLATGARIEEWSLFTAEQAEQALATGWLVALPQQRKGRRKAHEYAVTESLRQCLNALLALHHAEAAQWASDGTGSAPLVWGRDGKGLSVRSYQARMKHWAKVAGLEAKLSPHWLRHSRGLNILRRSGSDNPLKVVQRALGHASLASTGIYLEMQRADYVAALQRTDGARVPRAVARRAAMERAGVAA